MYVIKKVDPKAPPTGIIKVSAIIAFVQSIMFTKFVASLVVDCLQVLSFITEINRSLINLTVLSWSNGYGEAFACRAMSKNGFGEMAVTS